MALPDELVLQRGARIVFGIEGSISITDPATDFYSDGEGTPTWYALTMNALAAGAARHSIKADLGANRAPAYRVSGSIDFTGETLTAGEVVELWWLSSSSGTQANGNAGGNSGADEVAVNAPTQTGITVDEIKKYGIFIGNFVITDDATVQANPDIGVLVPTTRYGQLLIVNETTDPMEASDTECHIVFEPVRERVID